MKISGKAGALVFSVLLLVVGMASASVLDSFGVISGEADVDGPTFYAADNERLILEEPSGDLESDYSQVGPDPGDVEFYTSRDFGGKGWYDAEIEMYATVNKENEGKDASLEMEFEYQTEDDKWDGCKDYANFQDTNGGDYQVVEGSCKVNITGEVTNFQYVLSSNDELGLQAQGKTRAKVSAQ